MHALRSSPRIAGLVLVWFGLVLGSAVAASMTGATSIQLVCSSGGVLKVLETGDDDGSAWRPSPLDCPLCLTLSPPPVLRGVLSVLAAGLQEVQPAQAVPPLATAAAPPLPSRGPPLA